MSNVKSCGFAPYHFLIIVIDNQGFWMFYCQCCIVYCFAIYAGLIIPSLLCVDLSLNEKFPNKQLKKVRHSTIIVVNLSMSLKLTGSIMHVRWIALDFGMDQLFLTPILSTLILNWNECGSLTLFIYFI